MGECDPPEDGPGPGPHQGGGLLLLSPLGAEHRNQLPGHQGEGDKNGGQNDPRHGEHNGDPQPLQQGVEDTLPPVGQQIDQARRHRGQGDGQVDQGGQHPLAPEGVLGQAPGGDQAEQGVDDHRDRHGSQGQQNGLQCVGLGDGRQEYANPLSESYS